MGLVGLVRVTGVVVGGAWRETKGGGRGIGTRRGMDENSLPV